MAQDEGVVKIAEDIPGDLLDFVAGEGHVDARIDRFFHLDGEMTGMPMQVLCFAAKTVETVGILQI